MQLRGRGLPRRPLLEHVPLLANHFDSIRERIAEVLPQSRSMLREIQVEIFAASRLVPDSISSGRRAAEARRNERAGLHEVGDVPLAHVALVLVAQVRADCGRYLVCEHGYSCICSNSIVPSTVRIAPRRPLGV